MRVFGGLPTKSRILGPTPTRFVDLLSSPLRLLLVHSYSSPLRLRIDPFSLKSYPDTRTCSAGAMADYFYGGSSSYWDCNGLKKHLRQMSPRVQSHLKRVYLTLACALIASAVGVYLHTLWNIGGFLTGIACIGAVLYLLYIPPHTYNQGKRVKLLMAAAACEGATIGPLIDVAMDIDPTILVMAFVGTGLAFACFSVAAMVARRREFLYLGGLLGSAVTVLLWLQFASALFGGSAAIYMFEIYLGLVVFLGYIVFDTQVIIERADHGDSDFVKHSLELFTDFIAVFVRLTVIMLKNAASKSEKDKKKQRGD